MLSLQPRADVAPTLVIAIGNPSRGDDALGPLAGQRLAAMRLRDVEVLTEFQLQVEHALDLLGRRRVVFIDASTGISAPFALERQAAEADRSVTTHALSPAALLQQFRDLTGEDPPPAWVLAIRGEAFELGAPMSPSAQAHLDAALQGVVPLLAA